MGWGGEGRGCKVWDVMFDVVVYATAQLQLHTRTLE